MTLARPKAPQIAERALYARAGGQVHAPTPIAMRTMRRKSSRFLSRAKKASVNRRFLYISECNLSYRPIGDRTQWTGIQRACGCAQQGRRLKLRRSAVRRCYESRGGKLEKRDPSPSTMIGHARVAWGRFGRRRARNGFRCFYASVGARIECLPANDHLIRGRPANRCAPHALVALTYGRRRPVCRGGFRLPHAISRGMLTCSSSS